MKNYEEIAKNHLDIMIGNFKNSDFSGKSEKDINKYADFIKEQISFIQQINLVNIIAMNEYLLQVERKRTEELQKLSQKEYREQIINFNDDVLTDRERLVLSRQQEEHNREDNVMSVNQWLDVMNNDDTSTSSSSTNTEKEAMNRTKVQEKERARTDI